MASVHFSVSDMYVLCLSVLAPAGYGFVDFDSPASAQKAVTALKAGGVQAQMAKVRTGMFPSSGLVFHHSGMEIIHSWLGLNNSGSWLELHPEKVSKRKNIIRTSYRNTRKRNQWG